MWTFLLFYLLGAKMAHHDQRPDGSLAPSYADQLRAKWDARIPQQTTSDRSERERVAKTLPWYLALAKFCLLPSLFKDWRRELPDVPKKVARHNLHAVILRILTLATSALTIQHVFPMLFRGAEPAHFIASYTHTNPHDAATTVAVLVFVMGSFFGSLRWAPAWLFSGVSLLAMALYERRLRASRRLGYIPVIAHGREFIASYGAAIGIALTWPHRFTPAQEQHATLGALVGCVVGLAVSYAIPRRMFPSRAVPFAYLTSKASSPRKRTAPLRVSGVASGEGHGATGAPHAAVSADGVRSPASQSSGASPVPYFGAEDEYDPQDEADERLFHQEQRDQQILESSARVPHYTYESAFPALGFALPEEPRLLRRKDGSFQIDDSIPLRPPTN